MNIEGHIKETQQLFALWRENKQTPGEKIPEPLLERVAALSRSGVPHSELSRAFGVSGPKISKVLMLFPYANRNTLGKLHRKKELENHPKKHRENCFVAGNKFCVSVAENRNEKETDSKPQQAPFKNQNKIFNPVEQGIAQRTFESESPRSAVIQVIDPGCVQRIRDHCAVMSGEVVDVSPSKKNIMVGEMVNSFGTRLLLFENASSDTLRTMMVTFLKIDSEMLHAAT